MKEQDLLDWQLYEQFRNEYKVQPRGYEYKTSTSLFSGLRWLAEELLNISIPVIFATTHYSCWETILNEELYSREKPRIQPFTKLYLLKTEDVRSALQEFYHIDSKLVDGLEDAKLEELCGRPGFLFDCASNCFLPHPTTVDQLYKTLEAVSGRLGEWVTALFKQLNSGNAKEDLKLMHYLLTIHNGFTKHEKIMHNLVAAGIAIRTEGSAFVCEKLVTRYLEQCVNHTNIDKREAAMVAYHGSDYDALAERAIMLRLLKFKGTIADLLIKHWKTKTTFPNRVEDMLENFNVNLDGGGSFDEFQITDAHLAFSTESFLWNHRVFLARTGLSLPDIMFTSRDDNDFRCFVSIQVKTWVDRLGPFKPRRRKDENDDNNNNAKDDKKKKRFDSVVLNISRTHFFTGTPTQQAHFQTTWNKVMESFGGIYHVRIIICWAGFTTQQLELVNHFNQLHPEQPILLVCPQEDNFEALYGPEAFERIHSQMVGAKLPWTRKQLKQTVSDEEKDDFVEQVTIQLAPGEQT